MCVMKQLSDDKNIMFERKKQKQKNFSETCYINLGYYQVETDNKIQELPPFSKFVTEMLIFRNSRSQIFCKIGVVKNFAIVTGKH